MNSASVGISIVAVLGFEGSGTRAVQGDEPAMRVYFFFLCGGGEAGDWTPNVSIMATAIASIATAESRPCCGLLFPKIENVRRSPPAVVAKPDNTRTWSRPPVFAMMRPA